MSRRSARCRWSPRSSALFLDPLRVAVYVLLLRSRDPESAGGNVLGDHRPGPNIRPVADGHGRDEGAVDAGLDPSADLRPVLAEAVVVGRDVARRDVRAVADVGVAEVGQMGHLGPDADLRVLDLDERADLRGLADVGAGTEVGERADRGAGV